MLMITFPPLRLPPIGAVTQTSRSLIELWTNRASKDRYRNILQRIEDPEQDIDYEDLSSCLVDRHGNLRRFSQFEDEKFRFALDKLSDRKQRDRAARSRPSSPASSARSSLHPTPAIIEQSSPPEVVKITVQANVPPNLVSLDRSGDHAILDDAGISVPNGHGIFSRGNRVSSHLFPSICGVLSSGGVDETDERQYFGALAPSRVIVSCDSPVHYPCLTGEGAQEPCPFKNGGVRPAQSCNVDPLKDDPNLYDTPEEPGLDCDSSETCYYSSLSALSTSRECLVMVPDVSGVPRERGSSLFIHDNAVFCYKGTCPSS